MPDTNDTEVEDAVPELPEVEEGAEDTTDWKAVALKTQGMAKRFKTKIDKLTQSPPKTEAKPEAKNTPQEKKGFDYAEKAYLKASGIESTDFDLVYEVMNSTGKDIDGVLASKYFQAELKERKDLRMTADATPNGTKRSAASTRDSVEYWTAKIAAGTAKLGDIGDRDLRTKVLNARLKAESSKSQFTSVPVVNK